MTPQRWLTCLFVFSISSCKPCHNKKNFSSSYFETKVTYKKISLSQSQSLKVFKPSEISCFPLDAWLLGTQSRAGWDKARQPPTQLLHVTQAFYEAWILGSKCTAIPISHHIYDGVILHQGRCYFRKEIFKSAKRPKSLFPYNDGIT